MHHAEYRSTNPDNGNVTWSGPLSLEKGDHSHMPSRTDAYLPGDDRGHVNASSTGGANINDNIVPMHSNVNRAGGGYYAMEKGERTALKDASIHSEKTAVVNGAPGDRPEAFMVSDTVTRSDGQTEQIHNSFTNESYADQQQWNDLSASMPGTFDAPNPGDGLRDSMSAEEYAELMESTDAALPGVADDYAPADYSGVPDAAADADPGTDADVSADADTDD